MPGQGSWPYFAQQCPHCLYFEACEPTFIDDSGYEILGFCRHPRIAMELFRARKQWASQSERCPLFIGRITEPSGTGQSP
jgi:hypothetical protein